MKTKNSKRKCLKSICVDKNSYKITRVLLNDLYNQAHKAKQDPYFELLIQSENNEYYKLSCYVEKIRI